MEGDAVEALLRGNIGVLGHQVNLRGVMGAGIARQIRESFPNAYLEYARAVRDGRLHLGGVLCTEVLPGRYVAHLAGQNGFGRGLQTDYRALREALAALRVWTTERNLAVGLPFGIGCGLGGGDWRVVHAMIEETIPEAVLYRLPALGAG